MHFCHLSNQVLLYFRSLFCHCKFPSLHFLYWEDLFRLCRASFANTRVEHVICVREGSLSLYLFIKLVFAHTEHFLKFVIHSNRRTKAIAVFFNTSILWEVLVSLYPRRRQGFVNFRFWTHRRRNLFREFHPSIFGGKKFLCVGSALSRASSLDVFLNLFPVFVEEFVTHKKPFMLIRSPTTLL